MSKVLINHAAGRFYCWRWSRWFGFGKFFYCFQAGCRRMCAPAGLEWKAAHLDGVLVPAGEGD
jgi:hypothetical protein